MLRSPAVLDPILTQEMRKHPAWSCWCDLVALFTFLQKREFDVTDIERIDDMQLAYTASFDRVPEFRGLARPKHHFLTHLAASIWRHGPPCEYWCFGFEAFNKVMKAGGRVSNGKNTVRDVMEYWSLSTARAMQRAQDEDLVSSSEHVVKRVRHV